MDEVADLVITPFREIVDKANTAVQNAGDDHPEMLKAAQSLVKEGERALKKIEPQSKKLFDEFGYNFHDALKAHDEIAQYRNELSDLLWEFDDYIEVDEFVAEKFKELQQASRKAAPRINEILMRMKLEVPDDTPSLLGRLPTPTSPIGRHSVASFAPTSPQTQASRNSSQGDGMSAIGERLGEPEPPHQSIIVEPPAEQPPRPPSENPWEVKSSASATDEGRRTPEDGAERRAVVDSNESPVDPVSPFTLEADKRMSSTGGLEISDDRARHLSNQTASPPKYNLFPSLTTRPKPPAPAPSIAQSIPEESESNTINPHRRESSPTLGLSLPFRQSSRGLSTDSEALSPLDTRRPNIVSQITTDSRLTTDSRMTQDSRLTHDSGLSPDTHPIAAPSYDSAVSLTPEQLQNQPGLEVAVPMTQDDGLIPVEQEAITHSLPTNMSPRDCTIHSASSFYLNKGFCDGAKEVTRGGIGVKKTKKPVGFTTAATVARCTSCMCELDFKEIETDVCKQDAGNYSRSGIGYRLRFLQKSHLPAKRVDDVMYGCVFCVNLGRTLDESDATVFFSPQALFTHIARHPRPLPEVAGVTVVDQEEMPLHLRNDYDIHLKIHVKTHPVLEHSSEILQLPVVIAKEQARKLYGQRLLFDKTPAHELAAGARITGVTWPLKYNGDWCLGWHDGQHASIPFDVVRIESPPSHQVRMDGSSLIRAKARWKFLMKDKDKNKGEWLKFEKGEVITNISWSYFEHWCWSGTNSKGKWGIFPQAFIDINTISEPAALDRANSLTVEKNKSLGMLSKLSTRKQVPARPGSISGGSTHSNEYATPKLQSAFLSGSRGMRSGID